MVRRRLRRAVHGAGYPDDRRFGHHHSSGSRCIGDDGAAIEGSGLRSDFGIGILSIPGIANVTDEVLLAIDFVAVSG